MKTTAATAKELARQSKILKGIQSDLIQRAKRANTKRVQAQREQERLRQLVATWSSDKTWEIIRSGGNVPGQYLKHDPQGKRVQANVMINVRFALRGLGLDPCSVKWEDAEKIMRETFSIPPEDLTQSRITRELSKAGKQRMRGTLGYTAAERRSYEYRAREGRYWWR